jgi:glucan phosphoethanolaminetransferase (alkaline phosphatase superfamily)
MLTKRQLLTGVAICFAAHPLTFLILFLSYILFTQTFLIETNAVGLVGLLRFNFSVLCPIFAVLVAILGLVVFPWFERRGFLVSSVLVLLGSVLAVISTLCTRQYLSDWKDTSILDLVFLSGPILAFFLAIAIYFHVIRRRNDLEKHSVICSGH